MMVAPTLYSLVVERPEPSAAQPQGLCLDKGYDYAEVRATLTVFGFTAHIHARGKKRKRSNARLASRLVDGWW